MTEEKEKNRNTKPTKQSKVWKR